MFGLADCNNFFVSCERLFRPDLNGKPVVVLSNNDGCAISRSNEAKALGIGMGQPLYQFARLVESGQVTVFSSNFMLYGDISNRVHQTLRESVPSIEVYSIDEAFLDLRGIPDDSLDELGHRLNRLCMRNVGIPVSVGISHTKTLAKIASKLCKKYPRLGGACLMKRPQDIEKVLKSFPVSDVWGIGRRLTQRLAMRGVNTAYDFYCLPEQWVESRMGITGLRTWMELHSVPSISFEDQVEARQQICVSRSFAKEITDRDELYEQVALFTSMVCEKLRKQGSLASEVYVFMYTNRFRQSVEQMCLNRIEQLVPSTSDTLNVLRAVRFAFDAIYKKGVPIKKAGVILSGISQRRGHQLSLFTSEDSPESERLMSVIDRINRKEGPGCVSVASQASGGIRMNREHLSPQYTTKWDDILVVKVEK